MKKSRYTDSQIMEALKRVEAGIAVPDLCREFTDSRLGKGLWGITLEYIQPGQPQQNAYVERFNRTVRYEWFSQYHWETLDEVQLYATQWMWKYNHDRPNMALGGFTPKQRLAMAA